MHEAEEKKRSRKRPRKSKNVELEQAGKTKLKKSEIRQGR